MRNKFNFCIYIKKWVQSLYNYYKNEYNESSNSIFLNSLELILRESIRGLISIKIWVWSPRVDDTYLKCLLSLPEKMLELLCVIVNIHPSMTRDSSISIEKRGLGLALIKDNYLLIFNKIINSIFFASFVTHDTF